jgi:hypothetical protein
MSIDIVIPLGPNEMANIHRQLSYTRQNVIGFRNIYVICYDPSVHIDGCIMIQESSFPFTKEDVAEVFAKYNGKNNRNTWYYQQLLKLYVGFVIPDILDKYLIIDADVYFLKPIEFIIDDKMIFTTGNQYWEPYFTHMNKMHPSFLKNINQSGISHHMLFYKKYVKEIFDIVEDYHKSFFWKVFLDMVEEHKNHKIDYIESGASEYELYFNFVVKYHTNDIHIRKLNWEDMNYYFKPEQAGGYDFIALCHWKNW